MILTFLSDTLSTALSSAFFGNNFFASTSQSNFVSSRVAGIVLTIGP